MYSDWGLNPGPPALEASTIPLGYRGGGGSFDKSLHKNNTHARFSFFRLLTIFKKGAYLTIQIQYFTQNIKLVYNLIHLFSSTGETYFSANIKVISNKRPLDCIANMSEVKFTNYILI